MKNDKSSKVYPFEDSYETSSSISSNKIKVITLIVLITFFVYFIVVSVFFFDSFRSERKSLSTYEEIRDALANGDRLRLSMRYQYTDMYSNGVLRPSQDERSGFDIKDYQLIPKMSLGENNERAYITTSFLVLVNHSRYGVIYNFGKLCIYDDGLFDLFGLYFRPSDMAILTNTTIRSTLANKPALTIYQLTSKF